MPTVCPKTWSTKIVYIVSKRGPILPLILIGTIRVVSHKTCVFFPITRNLYFQEQFLLQKQLSIISHNELKSSHFQTMAFRIETATRNTDF
jgi:hypothetical protein